MSVAKRSPISARPTAEHLFRDVIHLTHNTIFVSPLYSTIWLICTVYKFVNRVLYKLGKCYMQLQYCFINAKVTKHHTGYRR